MTDVASFLKALEVRIERPKIDKATKMLKASGFKLFNDVTEGVTSAAWSRASRIPILLLSSGSMMAARTLAARKT